MKFLLALPLIFISGCVLNAKTCDPKTSASVFQSKTLKINKIVSLKGIKNIIFKSNSAPQIIKQSTSDRLLIEGVENVSVAGYHTDECTAEKMKKSMESAQPSLGYLMEIKGDTVVIKTTGERRFIHHENAFSTIKVRFPQGISFKHEHLTLISG